MNWDAVSAVAESLGAAGVVVSLAYLAHQIRRNTRALQGAAHETTTSRQHQFLLLLAQNPDLARLYEAGRSDFSRLSPDEQARLSALLTVVFSGIETTYWQHRRGNIDAPLWARYLLILQGFLSMPGVRAWLDDRAPPYTPEFRVLVDGERQKQPLPAAQQGAAAAAAQLSSIEPSSPLASTTGGSVNPGGAVPRS